MPIKTILIFIELLGVLRGDAPVTTCDQQVGKLQEKYTCLPDAFLGEGASAITFKVRHSSNEIRVLKVQHYNGERKIMVDKEIAVLLKMDHANVIRLFEFKTVDNLMLTVISYGERGSLGTLMKNQLFAGPQSLLRFTQSLLAGIDHIHSKKVVHCDIKPDNVVLDNNNNPIIIDFDLAYSPGDLFDAARGSPLYMAPEILIEEPHQLRYENDLYSTGVLLYEMQFGQVPFVGKSMNHLKSTVNSRKYRFPKDQDVMFAYVIHRCLQYNPLSRSTPANLIQDIEYYLERKEFATTQDDFTFTTDGSASKYQFFLQMGYDLVSRPMKKSPISGIQIAEGRPPFAKSERPPATLAPTIANIWTVKSPDQEERPFTAVEPTKITEAQKKAEYKPLYPNDMGKDRDFLAPLSSNQEVRGPAFNPTPALESNEIRDLIAKYTKKDQGTTKANENLVEKQTKPSAKPTFPELYNVPETHEFKTPPVTEPTVPSKLELYKEPTDMDEYLKRIDRIIEESKKKYPNAATSKPTEERPAYSPYTEKRVDLAEYRSPAAYTNYGTLATHNGVNPSATDKPIQTFTTNYNPTSYNLYGTENTKKANDYLYKEPAYQPTYQLKPENYNPASRLPSTDTLSTNSHSPEISSYNLKYDAQKPKWQPSVKPQTNFPEAKSPPKNYKPSYADYLQKEMAKLGSKPSSYLQELTGKNKIVDEMYRQRFLNGGPIPDSSRWSLAHKVVFILGLVTLLMIPVILVAIWRRRKAMEEASNPDSALDPQVAQTNAFVHMDSKDTVSVD